MSHQSLASLLNELSRNCQALISEGVASVIVSELSAEAAREIAKVARVASWSFHIVDSAGGETEVESGDEDFGPFRVELTKPLPDGHMHSDAQSSALYVVTEVGFRGFLGNGHSAQCWYVLGLNKPFATRARTYSDWGGSTSYVESQATKSPRLLVKEAANLRTVPEDIRHWLLAEGHSLDASEPLHAIWAVHAFDSLSRCLASEIDVTGRKLTFKGPPKLNLMMPERFQEGASIALEDFEVVQEAAAWVFDNAREAEVKHILLSAEIARSGRADGEAHLYFKDNLSAALDCAKIAYQMSVSEITKDTLKSLGDLRKAVTEETSKATDATRQAIAAISTALTVGLGLIAARLTLHINPYLISIVMMVALSYTALNVISGRKFINIQRALRDDWQPKLYRFLSEAEFKKMVADPIKEAEDLFFKISRIGLILLAMVAAGVMIFAFAYRGSTPVLAAASTSPAAPSAVPVAGPVSSPSAKDPEAAQK